LFFLIIRFVTSNQRKVRFEVHLGELWSVDSRQLTIIRSTSTRLQAPGVIADNPIVLLELEETFSYIKILLAAKLFFDSSHP